MKRVSFLFALFLLFVTVAGAQSQIPAALQKAFADRFPNASDVEWEDEDDGVYEVEFEQDDKDMTAKFNSSGNWLETETEIDEDELPAVIQQTIRSRFPNAEIDKAETISTPERSLAYEVTLDEDDSTVKVLFDTSGNVLQMEEKGED